MDTVVSYVRDILGAAPAGFEPLEYMISGCILVLLCFSAVSLVSGIFKWIGGI